MENTKSLNFTEPKEKKEPNYKIEEVANTPFSIVEKEGKFMVVLGNSICSEPLPTKKCALFKIKNKDWNLIGVMVSKMCTLVLTEMLGNQNEQQKVQKEKNNSQNND